MIISVNPIFIYLSVGTISTVQRKNFFLNRFPLSYDKKGSFTRALFDPSRSTAPSHRKMVKGRQGERIRLYVRGTILGYKRSKSNQYENTSLVQIEGVNTKEEVGWYAGKRMAYIYKAKTKKNGTHYRCIWGKVTRPHGNSGVVRAKFKTNLPPQSMGRKVRVFMYPSNI
ncbi:60S ribosomal protein L35a-3 [Dendrobium catenatum]|nr:60S ribosomal protein L35a-3 [Dendrobium catenatum]